MTEKEIIRTYICPDDASIHRDRTGFIPVEQYGSLVPEPREIGAIFDFHGGIKYIPSSVPGIWLLNGAVLKERIFIEDDTIYARGAP